MKKTTFLLVDTNTTALDELTGMLNLSGYQSILQTDNTNDAWSILREKPVGCIISAWDMPDMSGLALLKITRSDSRFFELPFFLTDASLTKVKVMEAGQAGVTGLLVSPFDTDTLTKKISGLAQTSFSALPETSVQSLENGIAHIEKGDYHQALEIFEQLTTSSENAEYYYNIGYLKTAQEKYGEAIEAFQKATQLDRLFAKAYEAMGRAYKELGQFDTAEQYLQKAADIYMSKENVENAETILNEILEISPDTSNVYNSLGVLYRKKGELETALHHYKKALKVHPKEPHIQYNIGRLYLDMKDPAQAKNHFSEAVKLDPNFSEALEVLNALELVSL